MSTELETVDPQPAALAIPTLMVAAAHRGGVELIEQWADRWRELCNEAWDDQPFYRPEWIAAHIRAFTPRAKVVLLTVTLEGKLLFVLPLLQEWAVFSGVPLRKLRAPVNSHSCRFDAVRHSSAQGEAAVVAAWNHLQSLRGWDLLELHDVPEGGTISALATAANNSGVHTAQVPMRRNPHVPVPADPAGLQKLPVNARLRGKLRHIRRELDKRGGLKFLRADKADRFLLDRFYELESAGWKGAEGSAIRCNPGIRQFYDEVSQAAERFGYLCLYSLELDGELLASHLGFSHKGRYFSPKIAYNEKFPQYAPGHLIVSEILQDCASRGISEYDITGANDEWKMKWTSETRAKFMHFVFRRGFPGSLAYALRFNVRPAAKKLVQSFAGARALIGNLGQTGRTLAKKIVPGRLIHEVRRYRRFKKPERPVYLKLRIANMLGLDSRKVPPGARSFVFVCFGNIMRSPMSEALFKEAIARHPTIAAKIVSAGLNATPGTPAHPWAITAAQDFGISLEGHRSALLTRAMVDEADAILGMDFQNQADFLSRYPDAAGKFFLLGAYSGAIRPIEILDPFFGDLGETRRCYRMLQTCTQNLAASLDTSTTQSPAISSGAQ